MPGDERLPYARQLVDEDDVAAVAATLRSDFLTTGPAVARFERDLAGATGARHVRVVSSGTAALHLAYAAAAIGPRTEVVTTPLTFAATANAALYLGADVVFADVDPSTGLIDPDAVASVVTDRTRAIVGVDYAGQPADYERLTAIAAPRGIALIADAAHSLGASRGGRTVGTLADVTTLSFHPVKAITSGEGGAVATDDDAIADKVVALRSHGIIRGDEPPWSQRMLDLGFNYRLTDVQAALGASQLAKLDRFIARRREIAAAYGVALADADGVELPVMEPGVESAWHLYVLRTSDAGRRRALFDELTRRGLGVQVHYPPVHLHPYYEELGFRPGAFPSAEGFSERCVSIPLFPAMTDSDVDRVVEAVREAARAVL